MNKAWTSHEQVVKILWNKLGLSLAKLKLNMKLELKLGVDAVDEAGVQLLVRVGVGWVGGRTKQK